MCIRDRYDGATCFLVSQFILDMGARSDFFRQLADRLVPGGILADADLSFDTQSEGYAALLAVWQWATTGSHDPADRERMRTGYAKDVSILPSTGVMSVIQSAGFDHPVPFFQAALVRAWFARRAVASEARHVGQSQGGNA
jgi:tRNA (cmo5U34)-methyltransferase